MSLENDFDRAVRSIMTSNVPVSLENKLHLYGYFNQAKRGDCKQQKPWQANDVLANQKWQAWKAKSGITRIDAMKQYIELVHKLLDSDKHKTLGLPPALPPLAGINSSRTWAKSKNEKANSSARSSANRGAAGNDAGAAGSNDKDDNSEEEPPELPQLPKSTSAEVDKTERAKLFRSRHFSSVAGLQNPLAGKEDIVERYEIYERVRKFYQKADPTRLTKGIGAIVEWTLENGIDKLNEQLQRKYGQNLETVEKVESTKIQKIKDDERKRRTSQIALSRRLMANTDPETRQKMDKLTRFLLVNDPELVSRGMYLLIKFIEARGVGALNENLKKNYGKSLDGVSDEELNAELKKKYGNDLDMLEKPLFGEVDDAEAMENAEAVAQATLKQQIMNMDPDKIRGTATEVTRRPDVAANDVESRRSKGRGKNRKSKSKSRTKGRKEANNNGAAEAGETGVDSKSKKTSSRPNQQTLFSMKTMDLHSPVHFKQFESRLKKFLTRYEPKRFDNALELMTDFTQKEGVDNLNKKLRKKYGVDLKNFDKIPVTSAEMSEDEFNLKLMQFVNKHEAAKNIERALKAMTGYKNKHGVEALNTKLYMKYGETLNDVGDTAEEEAKERGPSVISMHTMELSSDILDKLKSYYAKYDPMILASNGVEKIFQWAERNGLNALDRQLKAKYKESLSEYMLSEAKLKKELEDFYNAVDKSKLTTGFESVLAWALINGRDALNFNLRRKYNRDLDSPIAKATNDLPDV